jgi:glycosyltransferase involved in cell wall biosynthesis
MAHGRPPVISVITPTKNRLKLLSEAMDSVRAQTFAAWEHIVVDDGSDDGTTAEMERRAAADLRLRYIRRQGQTSGANVCRNIGVAASHGDFIVFLDSDDCLEPDCLARRVSILQRNLDLDFATFQAGVYVTTPGDLHRQFDPQLLGDDLSRFLFFEPPWVITGPVWRKTSLLRLGLFDESLPSWQDIDLHIRALTAGFHYVRFPEVDHHIRWQTEPNKVSMEQRRSRRHLDAANEILEKFEYAVRAGPGMDWVRQRALCSLYFFVAERWVAVGSLRAAMRSWRRIRERALGSRVLYWSGAAVLVLQALGAPGRRAGDRVGQKWKGWMRLRTIPELVT